MVFHSPWDQPAYKAKRKRVQKAVLKKAAKETKAPARKKVSKTPATKAPVRKKVTRKKALVRKVKGPRRTGKKSGIQWRSTGSSCGVSVPAGKGQPRTEQKIWQEDQWARGLIPGRPPRAWIKKSQPTDPGRPAAMSAAKATEFTKWWRSLTNQQKQAERKEGKKLAPQEIPVDRFGDPDLAWFVDSRKAGDKAGKILVMFSGGKDSLAMLLYVMESLHLHYGLDPRDHVECWHQCVDGRPMKFGGSPSTSGPSWRNAKWDWPVTEDYCRAVCEVLGIPLHFAWREGGLQGNVLRDNEPRSDMCFEVEGREICTKGDQNRLNTRQSYPAHSADLKTRWCSGDAKIDVAERQIRGREDLHGKRILYVSGERAEESRSRSTYVEREYYATWDPSAGRWSGLHGGTPRGSRQGPFHVEKWKPLHKWCEIDVWAIIARWGIRPHPAYEIGWGRLSCMTCIFGSPDQWASVRAIDPQRFGQWSRTERELIARQEADVKRKVKGSQTRITKVNTKPLEEFIEHGYKLSKESGGGRRPGLPFESLDVFPGLVRLAMSTRYGVDPILRPWKYKTPSGAPAGAFGEDAGPT